jgi:hypothetical protein
VAQVRKVRRERSARLERITTLQEAVAYQRQVRAVVESAFSPVPPKTPLHARVTGELELPNYRIERVVFESRPGCLVTANLYVT